MSTLRGKAVLVTGAAKRIGRGIALRLSAEGARVALHYHTSESAARRTAAECGGAPMFRADLENVAEIQRLFEEVAASLGPLDAVVNNAARFTSIDPLAITERDWDFIHNVNLKAVFFCCQAAARQMMPNGGGRIVNLSSLGGIRPWAEHAHYGASKAGVIMLTKALAKAWAPAISVNTVAPGVIAFPEDNAEELAPMIRATPMRRAGTDEEIAEAVVFFLTATKFITGQVTTVDGGLQHR